MKRLSVPMLREKLTPHVDEVVTDGLGGIFGIKHSEATDAPRVLVASLWTKLALWSARIKPDWNLPCR